MKFKSSTRDKILEVYEKYGYKRLLDIAIQMLKCNTHKDNKKFTAEVHGELCECILECSLRNYMETHKDRCKDWFITNGNIVKDIENPNSDYCAELDITLFTPKRIYLFECKSYRGDKTLTKEGTVVRKGCKPVNVFSQNYGHYDTVRKIFDKTRLTRDIDKAHTPYRLLYFDFSIGTVTDTREDKWKKALTYTNVANLYSIFEDYDTIPTYWNTEVLKKVMDLIDTHKEANTAKHLDYVIGLHKSKRSN